MGKSDKRQGTKCYMHSSMDALQRYSSEQKKPVSEDNVLCGYIYMVPWRWKNTAAESRPWVGRCWSGDRGVAAKKQPEAAVSGGWGCSLSFKE